MSAADLGTFEVAATAAEVAAFRRAARLEGEGLPFTYPIRWLALPPVRAAMMSLVPEANVVPFHESQTFEYLQPLQIGASYQLTVAAHRDTEPARLVIRGQIAGKVGSSVLAKVETVLRLLPTGQRA